MQQWCVMVGGRVSDCLIVLRDGWWQSVGLCNSGA